MNAQSYFQTCIRIIRHFASTRALEILALQASPVLGIFLGGFNFDGSGAIRLALLLLGSVALTAHVFVFNDWAGHKSDSHDPQRLTSLFDRKGISRLQVLFVAFGLFGLAGSAFAFVGIRAILIGSAIAALSLLYSASPGLGKSTPVMASINHLLGGALHFLLGYTLFHPLDTTGLLLSLFFGLVFTGGHLNQEVRDYEGDLLNGIRTNAVVFGRRRTFLASMFVFTAAYAMLTALALFDLLPKLLLWSMVPWCLQFFWFLQALKRGPGFETALWMQQRYRLLFALIGIAMLDGVVFHL